MMMPPRILTVSAALCAVGSRKRQAFGIAPMPVTLIIFITAAARPGILLIRADNVPDAVTAGNGRIACAATAARRMKNGT